MATYRYKAIDAAGRRLRGSMEAQDPGDLERRLERTGAHLLACRRAPRWLHCRRRHTRAQLMGFTAHLEQLVRAGVPLVEALEDLAITFEDPQWRDVVADLVASIEGGATLSQALAAFPNRFSAVYVAMVRMGEDSGRLPTVLRELTDALRWHDEIAAATRQVMIYPLIVVAVIGATAAFLMVFLVPKLTRFIEAMDAALPWYTQALIAVSNALVHWGWLIAVAAVGLGLTLRWLVRCSPWCRYRWDACKLGVWLFGELALRLRLARLAHGLALMYSAGVAILEALRLAESLAANAVLEDGIARARARVEAGDSLSEAFAAAAVFPPFVVRMMRVGETTGALDEALHNVSSFYARSVRERVARLQPAIQPVLTVVLAALIGWIALAVFWPIYDTMTSLEL